MTTVQVQFNLDSQTPISTYWSELADRVLAGESIGKDEARWCFVVPDARAT